MRRSHLLVTAVSAAILLAASAAAAGSASAATASPAPRASASASAAAVVLTTKTHTKPRPKGFTKFSYQTGVISGTAASAASLKKMNEVLAKDVKDSVFTARTTINGPCMAGTKRCGSFILTLAAPSCLTGYVCIAETNALLPPGANGTDEGVNTLVFDEKTGDNVGLGTFVSEKQTDAFLKAVNAGITAALVKGNIDATSKIWKPNVRLQDVNGWIATPEGMHLYFSKYAVAPGSFGVVDFTVPWSAIKA